MAISQELHNAVIGSIHSSPGAVELIGLLNAVSALSTTESGYIDGVTAGTAAASKAVVLSAAGQINLAGLTFGTSTAGTFISTGTTWLNHATAGQCCIKLLCSNSAATGDYATLRIRARADAAVANTQNVAATVGGNFSASANINDYGNLYGLQGLAQPNAFTQANTTNVICGVYSCMDRTGTHAGSAWSMWIDDHSTTAKAASHYLLRMSQNALGGTPVDIDGAITIQCSRLPVLFNFETADGFLTESGTKSNAAGYLAVKTPAGTKYINLCT